MTGIKKVDSIKNIIFERNDPVLMEKDQINERVEKPIPNPHNDEEPISKSSPDDKKIIPIDNLPSDFKDGNLRYIKILLDLFKEGETTDFNYPILLQIYFDNNNDKYVDVMKRLRQQDDFILNDYIKEHKTVGSKGISDIVTSGRYSSNHLDFFNRILESEKRKFFKENFKDENVKRFIKDLTEHILNKTFVPYDQKVIIEEDKIKLYNGVSISTSKIDGQVILNEIRKFDSSSYNINGNLKDYIIMLLEDTANFSKESDRKHSYFGSYLDNAVSKFIN